MKKALSAVLSMIVLGAFFVFGVWACRLLPLN